MEAALGVMAGLLLGGATVWFWWWVAPVTVAWPLLAVLTLAFLAIALVAAAVCWREVRDGT